MIKNLILGGAGFIGSHLCERLLETGKVVCVDNLSIGKRDNIKHLIKEPGFAFHEVDILNQKDFESVFRTHSFDAVFHFAANSDISKGDAQRDFRDTLSTTLVILEKMRVRAIKKLVFASSGAIYGESNQTLREDSGTFPISHYAAAKLSSEAFISSYCSMYDIQSWICRLPSVIGERVTHGIAFDFINKLKKDPKVLNVLGNGKQTKPYMYVGDLIDAILFVYDYASDRINYFNFAGIGRTSVKEIAEITIKVFGQKTKIVFDGKDKGWDGDVTDYDPSVVKLGNLGYVCKRTSDEAVEYSIKQLLK